VDRARSLFRDDVDGARTRGRMRFFGLFPAPVHVNCGVGPQAKRDGGSGWSEARTDVTGRGRVGCAAAAGSCELFSLGTGEVARPCRKDRCMAFLTKDGKRASVVERH
jgi:hypothetical protein